MSSVDASSSAAATSSAAPTSASSAAPSSAAPSSSAVVPSSSAAPPSSSSVSVPPSASSSASAAPPASSSAVASSVSSIISSAQNSASSVASASGPGAGSSAAASVSSLSSSLAASASSAQQVTTITQIVTRTGSNGALVTETNVLTSSLPSNNNNGSSSNTTGAIAGGVVGGVVGLALIAGLLFFFLRKRRRSLRDDFDDQMFDPGRAQNRAPVDLGDDQPAPSVEPFYTPGIASTAQSAAQSPQMSQYPRSAAATSDGGYYNNPTAPSSASTAGYAGLGAPTGGQPLTAMPEASNYLPGGSGSGAGYSAGQFAPAAAGAAAGAGIGAGAMAGMSAKQREAYQERQRFQVANDQATSPVDTNNQSSGSYSPTVTSPNPESERQTVVNQDAGPVEDDEPFRQGGDIPPTYDSIRR